jgi:hypothetical protein
VRPAYDAHGPEAAVNNAPGRSRKLLAIDVHARHLAWAFETEDSKKNVATYTNADGTPNYGAARGGDSLYDR